MRVGTTGIITSLKRKWLKTETTFVGSPSIKKQCTPAQPAVTSAIRFVRDPHTCTHKKWAWLEEPPQTSWHLANVRPAVRQVVSAAVKHVHSTAGGRKSTQDTAHCLLCAIPSEDDGSFIDRQMSRKWPTTLHLTLLHHCGTPFNYDVEDRLLTWG